MGDMISATHTIHISETLYQRLSRQARAGDKTVDEVAEQMLERVLPPSVGNVPERWRDYLEQMQAMDDETLWRIAQTDFPAELMEQYEDLLEANAKRDLLPSERLQLNMLRDEADLLMLRRGYASLLLHWRGYNIPNPYDVTSDE